MDERRLNLRTGACTEAGPLRTGADYCTAPKYVHALRKRIAKLNVFFRKNS